MKRQSLSAHCTREIINILPSLAIFDQISYASGCYYPIPYTGETQNETQSYRAAAGLTLTASAAFADEVRVYNWSDYIDENLLSKFEAETGLKLVYDVFDSNEVLETKMLVPRLGI